MPADRRAKLPGAEDGARRRDAPATRALRKLRYGRAALDADGAGARCCSRSRARASRTCSWPARIARRGKRSPVGRAIGAKRARVFPPTGDRSDRPHRHGGAGIGLVLATWAGGAPGRLPVRHHSEHLALDTSARLAPRRVHRGARGGGLRGSPPCVPSRMATRRRHDVGLGPAGQPGGGPVAPLAGGQGRSSRCRSRWPSCSCPAPRSSAGVWLRPGIGPRRRSHARRAV